MRTPRRRPARLAFPLAIFAAVAAALPARAEPEPARPRPPVYQRVVVLGASASAGYAALDGGTASLPLARVVDRMIRREHEPVVDASTPLFFGAPDFWAENRMSLALESRPTMVIALDFLFWFGYGVKDRPEDRLADLDRGFAWLERFDCPVLIALLPDMRRSVGRMLFAVQVPTPEQLAKINAKIQAWADSRPNVYVVPLVEFLDQIRSGQPVKIAGASFPARSTYLFVQEDELHPTVEGAVALVYLALHTAATRIAGVPSDAFELGDPLALARDIRLRGGVPVLIPPLR